MQDQDRQAYLEEALAVQRENVLLFPDDIVSRDGLAETLRQLGHHDEAAGIYRETIALFPHDAVARTGLAETLKALGRLDDALQLYQETMRLFPLHPPARVGFAAVLRETGIRRGPSRATRFPMRCSNTVTALCRLIAQRPFMPSSWSRQFLVRSRPNLVAFAVTLLQLPDLHPPRVLTQGVTNQRKPIRLPATSRPPVDSCRRRHRCYRRGAAREISHGRQPHAVQRAQHAGTDRPIDVPAPGGPPDLRLHRGARVAVFGSRWVPGPPTRLGWS